MNNSLLLRDFFLVKRVQNLPPERYHLSMQDKKEGLILLKGCYYFLNVTFHIELL